VDICNLFNPLFAQQVAGNYAADLLPNTEVKKKGFPIALYLDSKTNQYIEEFSTSNFLGIDAQVRLGLHKIRLFIMIPYPNLVFSPRTYNWSFF
jgi:branched-subunit amino acid aminotransferase/4-amino-4-deoxychorismate lyase